MKSTARFAGHPIHPMLIPYPFALLTTATLFDVLDRTRDDTPRRGDDRRLGHSAGHLQTAGLLSAVGAAVPGIVDYLGSVPRGTTASRHATWHAVLNSSALVAFLLARRERRANGETTPRGLGLAMLGTALLSAGGWLGGSLVYHHHVGVDDESPTALPGPERRRPRLQARTANM